MFRKKTNTANLRKIQENNTEIRRMFIKDGIDENRSYVLNKQKAIAEYIDNLLEKVPSKKIVDDDNSDIFETFIDIQEDLKNVYRRKNLNFAKPYAEMLTYADNLRDANRTKKDKLRAEKRRKAQIKRDLGKDKNSKVSVDEVYDKEKEIERLLNQYDSLLIQYDLSNEAGKAEINLRLKSVMQQYKERTKELCLLNKVSIQEVEMQQRKKFQFDKTKIGELTAILEDAEKEARDYEAQFEGTISNEEFDAHLDVLKNMSIGGEERMGLDKKSNVQGSQIYDNIANQFNKQKSESQDKISGLNDIQKMLSEKVKLLSKDLTKCSRTFLEKNEQYKEAMSVAEKEKIKGELLNLKRYIDINTATLKRYQQAQKSMNDQILINKSQDEQENLNILMRKAISISNPDDLIERDGKITADSEKATEDLDIATSILNRYTSDINLSGKLDKFDTELPQFEDVNFDDYASNLEKMYGLE